MPKQGEEQKTLLYIKQFPAKPVRRKVDEITRIPCGVVQKCQKNKIEMQV
jgi:hypothetical protein